MPAAAAAADHEPPEGGACERDADRSGRAAPRKGRADRQARRKERELARRKVKPGSQRRVKPSSSSALPQRSRGRTVFVVDDEHASRTMTAALLRRHGLTARSFENGLELVTALRKLADDDTSQWPAFVTLDVEMPVMDGREALRTMASDSELLRRAGKTHFADRLASLPVIVVSGNARLRDRQQMLYLGARAVVNKPVEPESLLRTLREFL